MDRSESQISPQEVNKRGKNGKKYAICLLSVGKSVNIWAIPSGTVKTET